MNDKYKVLAKLERLFTDKKVWWVLGGRTGLVLRGVEVEDDNELDICTTKEDAYRISKLLADYVSSPVVVEESPTFRAHIGKFTQDGVDIEVMGDPEKKLTDGSWIGLPKGNITTFSWQGRIINVFTLESEHRYYVQTSDEKPTRKVVAIAIAKRIRQLMGDK